MVASSSSTSMAMSLHSMIKVYFLFSFTTDYAIAATATIDDGGVCGKVDFVPDVTGNVNVTVNITGLTGTYVI